MTSHPQSARAAAAPRQAASLIVLRDTADGPEVLLLRRADKPGDQNSGAAVFPGGMLDRADAQAAAFSAGLDDAAASARLGVASGGAAYWVAAVRECFEEAGLLFARRTGEAGLVALDDHGDPLVDALRHDLHTGRIGLAEVCRRLDATLALDELTYYSHWITPVGMPKVFDTRFFVTRLPAGQTAHHDATETVELLWLRPAQALEAGRGLKLLNVTEVTLKQLAGFADAAAVIGFARGQSVVPTIRPRLAAAPQGKRRVVNPADWAYAEVGRLDPEGRATASAELVPGQPVWLSPRVMRVTAPNGNMMTGPGTNSYFIGAGDDWALLDPGPDDASHVQALLDRAPGRITRILVTHTHKDHSPAAAAVVAATGAPVFGRVASHPEWQDPEFDPTHVLGDGDRLALADGITLRVVHTPGHASNHLCYLLEEERLLFTGDHIMQGSTVVINPPDGDMAGYLRSLEKLLALDLEWLAPGHGFLIDQPQRAVRQLIAHRLGRETKVVAALHAFADGCDEDALLARVYADTPRRLHGVALRSLRAHLLKLQAEGRADHRGGLWRPIGDPG
jgi:glyoxylase-like metal-dependent hydrolase (beta-lactamase superfamily II)/8-oxo-dGTP pyrophosphatase MutT (NUDIX family)